MFPVKHFASERNTWQGEVEKSERTRLKWKKFHVKQQKCRQNTLFIIEKRKMFHVKQSKTRTILGSFGEITEQKQVKTRKNKQKSHKKQAKSIISSGFEQSKCKSRWALVRITGKN